MTEQATSNVSMKLGSSYLHRKVEQLMDSPLHRLHSYYISKGRHKRLDTAGLK